MAVGTPLIRETDSISTELCNALLWKTYSHVKPFRRFNLEFFPAGAHWTNQKIEWKQMSDLWVMGFKKHCLLPSGFPRLQNPTSQITSNSRELLGAFVFGTLFKWNVVLVLLLCNDNKVQSNLNTPTLFSSYFPPVMHYNVVFHVMLYCFLIGLPAAC